jgi:signal transduction histidine kinase/ligand-binding sensor domain-containing protein
MPRDPRLIAAVLAAGAALAPAAASALAPPPPGAAFRVWSWPDVAHTSTVWSVTQARAGHLWIATREGAVRLDGRRLVPLDARRVPGLVAREVTSIVEADGLLWIGAREGGLFAVRLHGPAEGEIVGRTPGLVVRQLAVAADGTLWVAAHDGMARVLPGERQARLINDGLPSPVSSRVAIGPDGTVWAGTAKGLARWRGEGRGWHAVAGPGGSTSAADALLPEGNGAIWVGSRDAGLWHLRDGTWRVRARAEGLPADSVIDLVRDRGGRLWVATVGGGLAWLDGERLRPVTTPAVVCADRALGLIEDREDGLWLATRCGLHRLRAPLFTTLGTAAGLPSARVLALAAIDGAPVAATDAGLARWQGGRFRALPCPAGACGECNAFAPARGGGAFVACVGQPLRAVAGDELRPAGVDARAVLDAADGTRFVDTGVALLRETAGVVTSISEAAGVGDRRLLHEGRAGRVWIVGSEGVLSWQRGTARLFRDERLPRASPASAYEDADGTLWIGTRGGGLRRLAGGALAQIDPRHGLPTGWIAHILEDDAGTLWMSSSRGLLRVARVALGELVAGRRAAVNVAVFDAHEGVALTEQPFLGTPSGLRAADGRLWFATNAGVVVVDPAALRVAAPPVTLDELRVGGRPLPLAAADRGDVRGGEELEIRFAAVTFEAPETVSTRYRLEGVDAAWTDAPAEAIARWARVPPGRYRFRARAVSRDGASLGPETVLAVTLAAPLHRRPWFVAVAAAAAAAALFWAHRLRLARARASLRAVMAERGRIARDIHDTLAQAFVATSAQLECADKALDEGDVRAAHEHLGAARQVVAGSLEEARRSIWWLRPQALEEGLAPAVKALVSRTSGEPPVSLEVSGRPRRLAPEVEAHLLRITQEAVANAARHARAARVDVQLRFEARNVTLIVRDDGAGIAAGGRRDAGGGPGGGPGGGAGLRGMRERAAELGARFHVDSGPAGTTVRVEVRA